LAIHEALRDHRVNIRDVLAALEDELEVAWSAVKAPMGNLIDSLAPRLSESDSGAAGTGHSLWRWEDRMLLAAGEAPERYSSICCLVAPFSTLSIETVAHAPSEAVYHVIEDVEFSQRGQSRWLAGAHAMPPKDVLLESFEGFVDQIDGGTAYVTLKSEHGDTLHGVYPAAKLAELGIKERRRFTCRTIERGGRVEVDLTAIPEMDVTPEDQQAIADRITKIFGLGSLEGDY
jgi:hypothetical protein